MQKDLKVTGEAGFKGMTISKARVVNVKFELRYSEIVKSVNLMQGLHNDIDVIARYRGKAHKLGMFKLDGVTFDRDGNSTISLKAMIDQVEVDEVAAVASLDPEEILALRFNAVLEIDGPVDPTDGDSIDDELPF